MQWMDKFLVWTPSTPIHFTLCTPPTERFIEQLLCSEGPEPCNRVGSSQQPTRLQTVAHNNNNLCIFMWRLNYGLRVQDWSERLCVCTHFAISDDVEHYQSKQKWSRGVCRKGLRVNYWCWNEIRPNICLCRTGPEFRRSQQQKHCGKLRSDCLLPCTETMWVDHHIYSQRQRWRRKRKQLTLTFFLLTV